MNMSSRKTDWKVGSPVMDSFSKFDTISKEEPYQNKIAMITRGNTQSPSMKFGR
jgi:hypothetical protein